LNVSSEQELPTLFILGVNVHRVSHQQALALLDAFAASGKLHHIVTVNPEFCVQALTNADFRHVLNQADLALPDGVGLVWAAKLLGKPLKGRVSGVDVVASVASLAAGRGYRLFFLGAAPGVAEAAAKALEDRNPGLHVAGCYAGSPRPEEDDEIVARVNAVRPHFLFVAFGAPQQDLWISRNQTQLQVAVAMGVGGSFDYISGRVSRAPAWMRRLGLEWLYRLLREPWRWRRMLRLPYFVWLVLVQWLGLRVTQ